MKKQQSIAPPLLTWYETHRRILPFREDPTPYHIWVSEIMLQQTRVQAALRYYDRFMAALPDVAALAACDEEKLHKLWEGLGYYSRARNMQKAAKIVMERWGGQLPGSYEELLGLPGIGEYTAGAIASIAFGKPCVAVDGNVLRVFSRLLANEGDITQPAVKKEISKEVQRQQPPQRAGDYNQALMELGALVCIPGVPKCGECPLQALCEGYKTGVAASLPRKKAPKEKVVCRVCVLVVHNGGGILLHRRPDKGLLAGLWEPVLLEGTYTKRQALEQLRLLLPDAAITAPLPAARHMFTHRVWEMYGWQCETKIKELPGEEYVFATWRELQAVYTVPGAFRAYLPFMAKHSS